MPVVLYVPLSLCWFFVVLQSHTPAFRARILTSSLYEQIKVLPCGHDFHAECLDPWLQLKATCPLCKVRQAWGLLL